MNIRLSAIGLLAASLAVLVAAGVAEARQPSARGARPFGVARPVSVSTINIDRRIDVNSLNMFVSNNGSFAYNLGAGDSGFFYPKGTDKSAIYASGLWLGANIISTVPDTSLGTVVAEYSMEYGPGAMTDLSTWDNTADPLNIVYKVVRFTGERNESGNLVDTMHVTREANDAAFEDGLVHHSWSEYMAGAAPKGAPWKLYRLEDTSTPAAGDSLDVPGPDVIGDMMLWAVYNDANPANHTNDAGGSVPMGIEIQQTTFAFNRQGALGNTVFMSYKLINKGSNTLEDMYISQWSDPDLGGSAGYTDDLVGCDTLPDGTGKARSLGFVYNSTNNDGGYGAAPPAVGYDFFRGPNVAADGDPPVYLGMTSFNKYINGTDPASTDETYAYMRGLDLHGDPVFDPYGVETRFNVAGDPVSPTPGVSWLDAVPADRRMMLSTGPFTMHPGDEQIVTCAIVVGQGKNRLSSVSALRFNDEFAQDAFDKDFDLPSPPVQPNVNASTDHGEITLSWNAESRTNYTEPGYAFEGYNVYQGATVAGPWTLIGTYDEINGTRVIYDRVFDVESGQLIPNYPTAFGSDAGVRFSHTITADAVKGGPIYDGTEYYFAVTSYSYNPDGLPKVLENAQEVVRVIPQRAAAGTDLATASATPVTYLQKDTSKPPATDVVSVEVVNPELVTGHAYKVTFEPTSPLFSGNVGTDTATVLYAWTLTDSTTGEVKFSGQLNRRGDPDYRVVDGIKVTVTGKYFPLFQDGVYLDNNTAHRRALTGVNWGLPGFFNGAGSGWDFFGGTIDPAAQPDSFTTVELHFSHTATQKAYRFLRRQLADGTGQGGYDYAGHHTVNMQAWDVVNNVQLDLAFVEKVVVDEDGTIQPPAAQVATFDSTWAPTTDATGDREYLFVIRRPYSDTPKAEIAQDATLVSDVLPLMWFLGARMRAASDVIDDGDGFRWIWANPAKDNDVYAFNTSALVQGDASVAKANLNRIRAVPNPYYAHSAYEINQFSRKLRFVNMPEQCTVRIFNLSGQLVRTLQKTSAATSILEWDLETANALPVGSGVYIFHVEVPGVGDYTGRVVVFMEKERLNSF